MKFHLFWHGYKVDIKNLILTAVMVIKKFVSQNSRAIRQRRYGKPYFLAAIGRSAWF